MGDSDEYDYKNIRRLVPSILCDGEDAQMY
jgi:hypothetical protein